MINRRTISIMQPRPKCCKINTYNRQITTMTYVKFSAPVGMTKNSWKASLLPACSPPLMTLKQGTGRVSGVGLPATSA